MRILLLILKATVEIILKNNSLKIWPNSLLEILIQYGQISPINYLKTLELFYTDSCLAIKVCKLDLLFCLHELWLLGLKDQKVKIVSEVLSY